MFMFTEINCSGLKDSRFNEQLLLAGLKMLGRDSEGNKTRSAETARHIETWGAVQKSRRANLFTTFIIRTLTCTME